MKNHVILAAACLSGLLMGFAIGQLESPVIDKAYGVTSPCGLYAIVVVYEDGRSEAYLPTSPRNPELELQIATLPADKKSAITVPCPKSSSLDSPV